MIHLGGTHLCENIFLQLLKIHNISKRGPNFLKLFMDVIYECS